MQPTETQVSAAQHYLEHEFPGQVQRTWWYEDVMAQVFEVQGEIQRHIVVDCGFFQDCQNCAVALKESELAEYIREALSPQCFIVRWNDDEVWVRSKRLS
ncbi:MAG: hypothetical protein OEU26_08460 [Candidatus Tectomicrobia bacterium]|nr:hypothetical protein [Candidatus Tectomicrobia bacterium]